MVTRNHLSWQPLVLFITQCKISRLQNHFSSRGMYHRFALIWSPLVEKGSIPWNHLLYRKWFLCEMVMWYIFEFTVQVCLSILTWTTEVAIYYCFIGCKVVGYVAKIWLDERIFAVFFRKEISILLVIVKNFLLDYKNFVQQGYVWQVTLFCMHNLNTSWAWQQFHLTSKVFEKTQFSTEYKVMFEIFLLQHSHISVIVNND